MRVIVGCIALIVLTLSGCQASKKILDVNTELVLNVFVSENANPDESDQNFPISIRLYQLKDAARFDEYSFLSLYENDRDLLAEDLIEKRDLQSIIPGEQYTEQWVIQDKRTAYIGILAEFIQFEKATSKLLIPIEQYSKNEHFIYVDRLLIEASQSPK